MMTPTWSLRRLHALVDAQIDELADVLIDCVEGDASVSFMHPLTRDRAVAFWRRVAQGVTAGERALLVAEDAQGLCGTVQLVLDQPENQPHRADLVKLLVHRRGRRQGVGTALMRAAEATARECGKTLLVLDAVTGGEAARRTMVSPFPTPSTFRRRTSDDAALMFSPSPSGNLSSVQALQLKDSRMERP